MNSNYESNTFQEVLKLYFKNKDLKDLQNYALNSYKQYIEQMINIIKEQNNHIIYKENNLDNTKNIEMKIRISGVKVNQFPMQDNIILTPSYCQLHNLSYVTQLKYDLAEIIYIEHDLINNSKTEEVIQKYENNTLFNIPVMVGSQLCTSNSQKDIISQHNPACYFIIGGKTKIIVPLERTSQNEISVHYVDQVLIASVKSKSHKDAFTNISSLDVFIRDFNITPQKELYLDIQFKSGQFNLKKGEGISILILFYALGICNDKEIIQLCSMGDQDVVKIMKQIINNFNINQRADFIKGKQYQKESNYINLQQELQVLALQELDEKKGSNIRQKDIIAILNENILQHASLYKEQGIQFQKKAEYLGFMIFNLLQVYLKKQEPTNRDLYIYKRLITQGQLLFQATEEIYKDSFKKVKQAFKNTQLNKQIIKSNNQSFDNFLVQNQISINLIKIIKTGKWTMKLEGVSQTYKSGSLYSQLLQVRKISNQPTYGQRKTTKFNQRYVDSTSIGYLATEESTEGETIGAVFPTAITCDISLEMNKKINDLIDLFDEYRVEELTIYTQLNKTQQLQHKEIIKQVQNLHLINYVSKLNHYTKILINGSICYLTNTSDKFMQLFDLLRDTQQIQRDISIFINEKLNYIYIYTDSGRYLRPVIKVKNNIPQVTQQDINDIVNNKYKSFDEFMLKNPSKIHYLELRESTNCLIAENIDYLNKNIKIKNHLMNDNLVGQGLLNNAYVNYQYIDIHPTILNGTISGTIQFFSHNPAVRNILCVAQKKRVIQEAIPDDIHFFNTKVYHLIGGDIQVIRTLIGEKTGLEKFSSGQMLQVMISQAGGSDQEDSVIFRRSSIQKLYLQTYEEIFESEINKTNQDKQQKFLITPEKQRNRDYNYDKIDNQGQIKPGTIVYKGDVIIGRIEQFNLQNQTVIQDNSTTFQGQEGVVIQSIFNQGKDGIQRQTVKIKQYIRLQVGDKMSVSSGGCKGTISNILEDNLFPFFSDGTQPDMIFNIHSVATRRSLGLLFDCVINNYAMQKIELIDGTPFQSGINVLDQAKEMLKQQGYDDLLKLDRIDPLQLKSVGKVLKGSLYYYASEQKSKDKIYAVDYGTSQKTLFTRHLVSGKSKQGGLKILADMEKSAFLAQNLSFVTQELRFDHNDGHIFDICSFCYNFCERDIQQKTFFCVYCKGKSDVINIKLSYANMQLYRILRAQGQSLKFLPQKSFLQIQQEQTKIKISKQKKK